MGKKSKGPLRNKGSSDAKRSSDGVQIVHKMEQVVIGSPNGQTGGKKR